MEARHLQEHVHSTGPIEHITGTVHILKECGRMNTLQIFHIYNTTRFVRFWRDSPPPSGPGPPHSRGFWITHNDAPQSVGLLCTSDQLVAETSNWQHTILTRHPCLRWDSNPRSQQASGAADLRLRPRAHWDRHNEIKRNKFKEICLAKPNVFFWYDNSK